MSIKKSFWRAVYLFSFLAVIGCTKNSHEQSPLDIPQVEVKDQNVTKYPWYHFCTWKNLSLEEWIQQKDAILIGTVEDIRPRLPRHLRQENSCWAYVKVEKWLKGKGPTSVWVRSMIDGHNKGFEDFDDLRYCNFIKNKNYVIFGRIYDDAQYEDTTFFISTATTKGAKPAGYSCGPTQELKQGFNDPFLLLVSKILQVRHDK